MELLDPVSVDARLLYTCLTVITGVFNGTLCPPDYDCLCADHISERMCLPSLYRMDPAVLCPLAIRHYDQLIRANGGKARETDVEPRIVLLKPPSYPTFSTSPPSVTFTGSTRSPPSAAAMRVGVDTLYSEQPPRGQEPPTPATTTAPLVTADGSRGTTAEDTGDSPPPLTRKQKEAARKARKKAMLFGLIGVTFGRLTAPTEAFVDSRFMPTTSSSIPNVTVNGTKEEGEEDDDDDDFFDLDEGTNATDVNGSSVSEIVRSERSAQGVTTEFFYEDEDGVMINEGGQARINDPVFQRMQQEDQQPSRPTSGQSSPPTVVVTRKPSPPPSASTGTSEKPPIAMASEGVEKERLEVGRLVDVVIDFCKMTQNLMYVTLGALALVLLLVVTCLACWLWRLKRGSPVMTEEDAPPQIVRVPQPNPPRTRGGSRERYRSQSTLRTVKEELSSEEEESLVGPQLDRSLRGEECDYSKIAADEGSTEPLLSATGAVPKRKTQHAQVETHFGPPAPPPPPPPTPAFQQDQQLQQQNRRPFSLLLRPTSTEDFCRGLREHAAEVLQRKQPSQESLEMTVMGAVRECSK